jgi:hypothetical protein
MAAPSHSDIARIIKVVGIEGVDKAALLRDLDFSGTHFRTRQAMARNRALRKDWEKVEATALKLVKLLTGEMRKSLDVPDGHRAIVGSIMKAASRRLRPQGVTKLAEAIIDKKLASALGVQQLSAFEWLVGVRLPNIFKKHFKVEAGYTRNPYADPGTVEGAYIRFATESLKVLSVTKNGKPYSAESIARAMSRAKGGKSRKKP